MGMLLARGLIAGLVVIAVSGISKSFPRLGAVVLTLPLVSILAFVATWLETGDVGATARLARETLVLVPLGLPFFIPIAFAPQLGLSFWPAMGLGVALATLTVGAWLWLGPRMV